MTGVPCYLLDTNILLRFLQGDHAVHSAASRRLLEKARKGDCILEIPFIAIIETFHTLKKFYHTDKKLAGLEILKILSARGVRVTAPNWLGDAIHTYLIHNISFGDACIAAEAKDSGRMIASFDRDFDAITDVKRLEPK